MNKELAIKKFCEIFNISIENIYEAYALDLKEGVRFVQGFVINNQYFFDILTEKFYLVEELNRLENVDEYED